MPSIRDPKGDFLKPSDGKIKVSETDSNPGFLDDKIALGGGLQRTINDLGGGNEEYELAIDPLLKDRIASTALDTLPAFLDEKILSGAGIELPIITGPFGDAMQIVAQPNNQALVSSTDTTQGYLDDKIVSSATIDTVKLNPIGDEKVELNLKQPLATNLNLASGQVYQVTGTQVVKAQEAAVADASGGGTVDTEARTALNDLLAKLRNHGLIAT